EGVLTDSHRRQEFQKQDFPGMDVRQLFHYSGDSVVIHDFNLIAEAFAPQEADAPLIVDADTMLTGAPPLQYFQMVHIVTIRHLGTIGPKADRTTQTRNFD